MAYGKDIDSRAVSTNRWGQSREEIIDLTNEPSLRELYPMLFTRVGAIDRGTFSPAIDDMVRSQSDHNWDNLGAYTFSIISSWGRFGRVEVLLLRHDLGRLEAKASV